MVSIYFLLLTVPPLSSRTLPRAQHRAVQAAVQDGSATAELATWGAAPQQVVRNECWGKHDQNAHTPPRAPEETLPLQFPPSQLQQLDKAHQPTEASFWRSGLWEEKEWRGRIQARCRAAMEVLTFPLLFHSLREHGHTGMSVSKHTHTDCTSSACLFFSDSFRHNFEENTRDLFYVAVGTAQKPTAIKREPERNLQLWIFSPIHSLIHPSFHSASSCHLALWNRSQSHACLLFFFFLL